MNIVLKVNKEVQDKMIEYYTPKKRDKQIPYVLLQADDNDTVITMYTSGKVMFQGVSADVDAMMWQEMMGVSKEEKKKKEEQDQKYHNCNSVGSDEVGTGDYFGPIVVTASYVTRGDEKILKIAPQIAKRVKYRSLILSNLEYNTKYTKDINMNKIKSIMHNKVLYQLVHEEQPEYDYIIVDEFAREARYYGYLTGINDVQRDITFMTKAEDKNLAVACSSIISRYIFLKEFDKLSDSLGIPLVKGAGSEVDKIGEEVVEKYGKEKLKEIAKLNFANTKRILHTMIF